MAVLATSAATMPLVHRILGWIAMCSLFLLGPVHASTERRGIPWTGEAAVQKRTDAIMSAQKNVAATSPSGTAKLDFDFEFETPDRDVEINIPVTADAPPYVPDVPGSPQTLGISFTGATLTDTLAYPPDTMGAVGPSQFIVAVNGRIRSFNKFTGLADGVINADTDVFFNSVMTPPASNNFTSDPRIRYDRLSGRWFVIIIDVPGRAGTLPNRVMIAVSDGPVITATSVWSFFYFQHDLVTPASRTDTGAFADYPSLGIDAKALYIGVNIFGTRGQGSFANTTGFVVRKSSLLGAGPIVVTAFRNLIANGPAGGPYTPQGVDNYDPNANEGYFLGVDSQYYGKLQLVRISNPGGTPTASAVSFSLPVINGGTIRVPHLGNTGGSAGELDGLDYRLLAAHLRNGRLWTSENLAVDNTGSPSGTDTRMGVRWYEIQGIATGQTPSVVQFGTVFQPSASNTTGERSYWMGTIMVSGQGHAAMGFSAASATEHVNAATCGRLVTDPAGTMQTPVLYTASTNAYNPRDGSGNPIERWGDYSYTSLDPSDDMTMWTIQEFCNAENSYGVQVVKLLAPPPATPTNCNPAIVAQGATNVNVTVTGQVVSGSGFFDPGTGFSNRIAAAVSGSGVAVNKITYTDPTHITLNLSVSGVAPAGSRTITVTNPDGQAITSGALLTVTTAASNNAPVLSAIPNATVNEGSNVTFTATASDADAGQTLTYSLDPGAPSGASINATNGVFTWTPTEAQGPGTNSITVRVTDNGVPALSDAKTFTVTVNEVNVAPALAPISNRTINEGSTVTITNTATDTDIPANAITFSLGTNAPAGASVNPSTGIFTWTPTEAQGPGVFSVTVVATDNGAPAFSDSKTFSITVDEVNTAPVLAALSNRTIHAGTTLIITNSATDADVPTNSLTYSLTNSPAGMAINSVSGVVTWTPSDVQADTTNSFTVRVTDNGSPNLNDTKTATVTVLPRPSFLPASISGSVVTLSWTAIVGQGYRVQYKNDLTDSSWTDLGDVTANSSTATLNDSIGSTERFYRIILL